MLQSLGVPQPGAAKALIDGIAPLAPSMLQPWVSFYRSYPELLAMIGIPIIVLMVLSSRVQAGLAERMRQLWSAIVTAPPRSVNPSSPPTDVIYRLRTHWLYRKTFEVVTRNVFPFVFGVGTLAAIVLVLVGTANRAAFSIASASGQVCAGQNPPELTTLTRVSLPSWELCTPAPVRLTSGETYRVRTTLPPGGWKDASQLVVSTAGFSSGDNLFVLPFLPFRRVLREQWFVPIARVGVFPSEHHPLNQEDVVFTPRVSGQLFLFVNDAVLVGGWNPFYDNNDEDNRSRVTTVEIERLDPAERAAAVPSHTADAQ